MLLTDGNPNDTEDLQVYESAILSCGEHGGDRPGGRSCDLATEEISEDVLDVLLDHTRASRPAVDDRGGRSACRTWWCRRR